MAAREWAAQTLGPGTVRPGYVGWTPWRHPTPTGATASVGLTGVREAVEDAPRRTFLALAEAWRQETAPLSSVTEIVLHPAYQRIIGMGPVVLPWILAELARRPDHWFWALRAITAENPVAEEDAGNLGRMRDAWVRLGRARGWL